MKKVNMKIYNIAENKLKELNVKSRTYNYLHDVINIIDPDFENIVFYERSCKIFLFITLDINFYVLQNLCKDLIFHKINGFIKDYARSKYLKLILADEKKKGLLKKYKEIRVK